MTVRVQAGASAEVIQASINLAGASKVPLEFEPGTYWVGQSLDFSPVALVRGNGAVLVGGGCEVVMNWTGRNRFRVDDLTIKGDDDLPPQVGVMLARTTGNASAGRGLFTNVATEGRFKHAGLFSHQTESSLFQHCLFINTEPTERSYAAVFTGLNPDNVTSPHAPISAVASTHSFNSFVKCSFFHNGAAPDVASAPLYLGSASSFDFSGCIFHDACDNLALVRMAREGPGRGLARIAFRDCVFHPRYAAAIAIEAGSRVDRLTVEGCQLDAQSPTDIAGTGDDVHLYACKLEASKVDLGGARCRLVDGSTVHLDIEVSAMQRLDIGGAQSQFNGHVMAHSSADISMGPVHTGTVWRTNTGELVTL